LDGAAGYALAFLDECVGKLVYDFGEDAVRRHFKIIRILMILVLQR